MSAEAMRPVRRTAYVDLVFANMLSDDSIYSCRKLHRARFVSAKANQH